MKITHSYEGLGLKYYRARKGTPKFVAFMLSHAGLNRNKRNLPLTIVELGVGSGQQTEFVEKQLDTMGISHYKILAYDKSYQSDSDKGSGQLDVLLDRIERGEISQRVVPVPYDFDGTSLPLEPNSVDLSYMAWVFHHLTNKQAVLDDIARISQKGVRHFMYQVTIEDLVNHQLDEFFPMKYEYDKQRYPTRSEMKEMFLNAGFTYEKPYIIKRDIPKLIDRAMLESVEDTSIDSALKMIKDNEPRAFEVGVSLVRKEVERAELSGKYRQYRRAERKVFWGIKR